MNFGESVSYIQEYMQSMFSLNKMSEGKQFALREEFIKQEYNNLYKKFAAKVRTNLQKQQIATVTGQATYNLDTTFYLIDFVFYNQTDEIWRMKRIEGPDELGYAQSLSSLSDYDPSYYDTKYQSGTITLYPTPRASGDVVTVFGRKLVTDLILDSETADLPANFHSALCDFVIARLTLMCGFFDQSKFNVVQLSQKLEMDVINAANDCRKQTNFTNDNAAYTLGAYDNYLEIYNNPVVSNNPVVNFIKYISPLTFQNYSTGLNGLVIDSDSVQFNNDVTGAELLHVTSSVFKWKGVPLWKSTTIDIDAASFDYTYAGTLGSSYELTVYAYRTVPELAQSEDVIHVSHWADTFTPNLALLSSFRNKVAGADIEFTYTPTAGSANIAINVTNATGGKLIINVRHATSHT